MPSPPAPQQAPLPQRLAPALEPPIAHPPRRLAPAQLVGSTHQPVDTPPQPVAYPHQPVAYPPAPPRASSTKDRTMYGSPTNIGSEYRKVALHHLSPDLHTEAKNKVSNRADDHRAFSVWPMVLFPLFGLSLGIAVCFVG
ncbi:hypothetical protein L198_05843 [Cryptococcus wingfieldii CBS 7118]|uniref:Uncharacterized protein n=1 Tax=Cryptococcus wingfieldii CBS 7118 TaxID=1295528 RepID=A0A1E3IRX9_9TREE|nr:hypothetical protein L198_05843 [Cryptococcus wingfieldii CBS 7118]ODN91332.1 hypothetical protein L198_05843 [Cryptococcus wingfieldii CBS 7118]